MFNIGECVPMILIFVKTPKNFIFSLLWRLLHPLTYLTIKICIKKVSLHHFPRSIVSVTSVEHPAKNSKNAIN